jgi:hypothetical protein
MGEIQPDTGLRRMLYPSVVAIVAFTFAGILLKQYLDRHRPYQLVWTVSLSLGGLAGLAFDLFLLDHRSITFFRLYYITGALLMAAYLGLGSVYLLAPRRIAYGIAAIVIALSIIGTVVIASTPIQAGTLHGANVEAGTRSISGPAIALVAILNTFGAFAVIGGAAYSAWGVWKRQGPPRLLAANVLIAAGTICASLAGTLARLTAHGSAFWSLLALGFAILFSGFLLTGMTRPARVEQDASAPVLHTSA